MTAPPTAHAGFKPSMVEFAEREPDCFSLDDVGGTIEYRGQAAAKERLRRYIAGLGRTHRRLKALLTGPAGTGKTTLARIVAKAINERHQELGWGAYGMGGMYFELLPAQVETKEQMDEFFKILVNHPFAVVFIDEVHELSIKEALFHVLHDSGAPKYPLSDGQWLSIADTVSFLTATTDPGSMDDTNGGALRRRLEPEIMLEPPSKEDLAYIILDQGEADGLTVHPDAADDMAGRSWFPWQAKNVYNEAKLSAVLADSTQISPHHANEAFRVMRMDRLGLIPEDRQIIQALLRVNGGKGIRLVSDPDTVRFRMGEESLCAIAGVDRVTYKKRVQPKLQRLGLLVTLGGQCLTEKALDAYAWLREER